MGASRFKDRLKTWRGSMRSAEVDRRLAAELEPQGVDLPPRFTSQIENGRLRAPDQPIARAIGRVFGVDEDAVWQMAVRDRLEQAGVLEFHDLAVARARSDVAPTEDEARLVASIRAVGERLWGDSAVLVRMLTSLTRGLTALVPHDEREDDPDWPGGLLYTAHPPKALGYFARAMGHWEALEKHGDADCQLEMLEKFEAAARATAADVGYLGPLQLGRKARRVVDGHDGE